MTDDQFFALLTSKRDEGLAHVTDIIERTGVDSFSQFLVRRLSQVVEGNSESVSDLTQFLIDSLVIIGAVDALLAHRDAQRGEG